MSISVEWVCDPIAQHVDYVHNTVADTNVTGRDKSGRPHTDYLPMYKYAFPEFFTCDLGILDNRDVVRRNNLSLLRGWRSDVAIYRCRATIDSASVYKEYLKKVNALRDKFRPLILNGVFRDTDIAECTNPQIEYAVYTDADRLAVVATQSHLNDAAAKFSADGYKYAECSSIGGCEVKPDGEAVSVSLKKDAVVVLVFQKK